MYDLIRKNGFRFQYIKKQLTVFCSDQLFYYIFYDCIIYNGSDHSQRHMKQHIIIFTIEYFIFNFLFCC